MASNASSLKPSFLSRVWSRRWIVGAVAFVVFAGVAVVSARQPDLYASEARVLLLPSFVSPSVVPEVATTPIDDRVRTLNDQIMSRVRLERIIENLDLYPDERRTELMEDVVEQMRRAIEIKTEGDRVVTIRFTSTKPVTAQKVADRLANTMIDEYVRSNDTAAISVSQFLESETTEVRRRVDDCEAQLATTRSAGRMPTRSDLITCEFYVERFKSLLAKKEDAAMANSLMNRQLGTTLRITDPARIPERPIGPSRWLILSLGLALGLAAGAVVGFVVAPRK